jgi:hypothetical protein
MSSENSHAADYYSAKTKELLIHTTACLILKAITT